MSDEGFEIFDVSEQPPRRGERIPRRVSNEGILPPPHGQAKAARPDQIAAETKPPVSFGHAAEAGMPPLPSSLSDDADFYVIDYDSGPFAGVGKFVLKTPSQSQKVVPPPEAEKDEVRDLFDRMRDIARAEERVWMREESRFYVARERRESARVFYKQAVFMRDFTDDFAEKVGFSAYFPCYQMMGYKQLRSYFTWRSRVRRGEVAETSVSYMFLYIYELLNNVGVGSPQEGLERLLAFLGDFSFHGGVSLNAYLVRWLKDYYVYYGLEGSFGDFVEACGLGKYYPEMEGRKDGRTEGVGSFDWFCSVSKY
ncbi:MAG: TerB N-terminal domain-containing protein, partial [Clostridiales bacterium]|nr:TerB N-terminal domain-containing protein [Clostridiales bacterium]